MPVLIPRSVLFGGGERSNLQIAPDGQLLAYVGPHDGVANIHVMPVGGGEPRAITNDSGRGIHTFQWAPDSRHVIHQHDVGGDENWQLSLTDIEGQATRPLVALSGVQSLVLAIDRRYPDTIVVGVNDRDPRWHDAYRVTLSTGELSLAAENPGFTRWAIDADLQARGGVRTRADGGAELHVRDDERAEWRLALEFDPDDAFEVTFSVFPMWFSKDGRGLYLLTSKDHPTARIARYDLAAATLETVAGDPEHDVRFITFNPATYEPEIGYVPKVRMTYALGDPALKTDVEAIQGVVSGDFMVESRDDDDRQWVLHVFGDDQPGAYYVYDRERHEARLVFEHQPAIHDYATARMEGFSFRARDGLTVHGYLTFPPEASRRGLPLVVMPHGGPYDRDTWGFEPRVQLLANRGYLVMHVNYRGSLGYGKAFVAASHREWGRAMHHDVLDAIAWAVREGYVDGERIAMWGNSYGGYETLFTVTNDPELLRCAVAGTAIVNLTTFMKALPPYWSAERSVLVRGVGDPETDEALLWERSPLRRADHIKSPLLMIYGERDPRVPLSEAQQMADALTANGIEHELVVLPEVGHSLLSGTNEQRMELARRVETFLAAHLGGRHEP